jgi:rhamnosyltransferase subunit B
LPPPSLHVILASIGTDGDVFPYVGLGIALRGRGHRVTLAAAEDYRAMADANGFAFQPLFTVAENRALIEDPDFWHPLKGPVVGARWGVRFLATNYDVFVALAADGPAVFVASPGLLAARVARDKLGFPMVSLLPQPWMIPSCVEPRVMPGGLTLPRWAPRPLGRLYMRGINAIGYALIGRELNALRERVGLPPVRQVFEWWLSPDLIVGAFPEAYGRPQPDWPPHVRLVGFPLYDGRPLAPLPEDLMAFCRESGGEAPIAFTFGTGMRHAARHFAAAVEACRLLGRRGILLTRYADQLPAPLPETVRHVPFAAFGELFPRCAAVVHHGGIGTVARALAAGLPQLILPIAYDQKDNAVRVRRLGAGDGLRGWQVSGPRIARALDRLLAPDARERCRTLAERFAAVDALGAAAHEVEQLAARHVAPACTAEATAIPSAAT